MAPARPCCRQQPEATRSTHPARQLLAGYQASGRDLSGILPGSYSESSLDILGMQHLPFLSLPSVLLTCPPPPPALPHACYRRPTLSDLSCLEFPASCTLMARQGHAVPCMCPFPGLLLTALLMCPSCMFLRCAPPMCPSHVPLIRTPSMGCFQVPLPSAPPMYPFHELLPRALPPCAPPKSAALCPSYALLPSAPLMWISPCPHRWVRSVAVDPGNEWFATGSADRTIKIWDLASGQLKLTLTGHIEQVHSALKSLGCRELGKGEGGPGGLEVSHLALPVTVCSASLPSGCTFTACITNIVCMLCICMHSCIMC